MIMHNIAVLISHEIMGHLLRTHLYVLVKLGD